jgi:hypothetical protein
VNLAALTSRKLEESGVPLDALGRLVGSRMTLTGCVQVTPFARATVLPALGGDAEMFAVSLTTESLLRGAVSLEEMKEAIGRSVEVQLIDPKWLEWDSIEEVWVGVALRVDQDLDTGSVYTFLPTEQISPVCAQVQAPFFANLARRRVDYAVPLNTFLMNRIAATCLDFMRILRDHAPQQKVAAAVVDLIAWEPERSDHLLEACPEFTAENCLAVADGRSWSCLDEAYTWPTADPESVQSVITPAAVARLGYPIVQPAIGRMRLARLKALHEAVTIDELRIVMRWRLDEWHTPCLALV